MSFKNLILFISTTLPSFLITGCFNSGNNDYDDKKNPGYTPYVFGFDSKNELQTVLDYQSTHTSEKGYEYIYLDCSSFNIDKYCLFALLSGNNQKLEEREMYQRTPFINASHNSKTIQVCLPIKDEYNFDNLIWSTTTSLEGHWVQDFNNNRANNIDEMHYVALMEYCGSPDINNQSRFYSKLSDGEKTITNIVGDISLRDYFEENKNTIADAIKEASIKAKEAR